MIENPLHGNLYCFICNHSMYFESLVSDTSMCGKCGFRTSKMIEKLKDIEYYFEIYLERKEYEYNEISLSYGKGIIHSWQVNEAKNEVKGLVEISKSHQKILNWALLNKRFEEEYFETMVIRRLSDIILRIGKANG